MSTHNTDDRKTAILDALDAFVRQRPGLEFGNYGDVTSYRSEMRSITKDLHEYRALRAAVQWRDGIDADALLNAARSAYSGRLTLTEDKIQSPRYPMVQHNKGTFTVAYCTGQYFPTEYRKAACAVLAQALWYYTREQAMPAPCEHRVRNYSVSDEQAGKWQGIHAAAEELAARGDGCYIEDRYKLPGSDRKGSAGDWLRAYFAREFGRGIARRWFN